MHNHLYQRRVVSLFLPSRIDILKILLTVIMTQGNILFLSTEHTMTFQKVKITYVYFDF